MLQKDTTKQFKKQDLEKIYAIPISLEESHSKYIKYLYNTTITKKMIKFKIGQRLEQTLQKMR